jgi:hypothetical protein
MPNKGQEPSRSSVRPAVVVDIEVERSVSAALCVRQ